MNPNIATNLEQAGLAHHHAGWVCLKRILLLAAIIVAFVEFLGLPHLRVSYDYRGPADNPSIIAARYWSVTGTREVHYLEMGDRMPLVALFHLDRSVFSYGLDAVSWSWSYVTEG